MDWKDFGNALAKMAPMIATGIAGPLAGGAVAALEKVFGIETEGTLDDKQSALVAAFGGATQEQLLALKKADQDYAVQMAELGFKNQEALASMQYKDVDSARQREAAVKDNTPKILAYAITLGFFGVLATLMYGGIPSEAKDVLYIMLGTLGTAWTGVTSYYFGSTAGSKAKSELLATASKPAK